MSDSYGQMWRRLLLYCPFLPIPLAQAWVKDRYRVLLDAGGQWGGQTAQSQFIIPTAYTTGTVDLVQSSTSVVGTGTAWTSALEQQQLYIAGCGPYYTISSVIDATHLTLESAFGGTSQTGIAYEIAQAYVTPPSDFLYFKSIKDPVNNWRLRFNVSQETLDKWDSRRSTAGNAWLFADYRQTSAGIPRYEVWPRVVSERLYPYLYVKRPADLSADSDVPIFPIRGDELIEGALADLSRWPGTESRKNPSFNLQLAADYEKRFTNLVNNLSRLDQETYLSDYVGPNDAWSPGGFDPPISAAFWQNHDIL